MTQRHADPACGCGCDGAEAGPRLPPPGQRTLRLRSGTHGSFLRAMERHLAASRHLHGLHTRARDDYTAALLDAWAGVGDVLSFYEERIANEGYLRTADERASVLQLARMVGYELRPGIAARTPLVFEVDPMAAAPEGVQIPAGTRVLATPAPGKDPAPFETMAPVAGRPEWNAMRARATRPVAFAAGQRELYLKGAAAPVKAGDALLFLGAGAQGSAAAPDWQMVFVEEVERWQDPAGGWTRVAWRPGLGQGLLCGGAAPTSKVKVYAMRLRASVFGHNAPDIRAFPAERRSEFSADGNWDGFAVPASTMLDLEGAHPEVVPGGWLVAVRPGIRKKEKPATFLWGFLPLFIKVQQAGQAEVAQPVGSVGTPKVPGAATDMSGTPTDFPPPDQYEDLEGDQGTVARLHRVGSARPVTRSMFTLSGKATAVTLDRNLDGAFAEHRRTMAVYAQSEELEAAEPPEWTPLSGSAVELAGPVPALPKDRTAVVTGRRFRAIVRDGHTLQLQPAGGGAPVPLVAGDQLGVLQAPPAGSDPGTWTLLHRSGVRGTVPAARGALLLRNALPADPPLAEAHTVVRVEEAGPRTRLVFAKPLEEAYDPASVLIHGNAVPATHGETVEEVLGSGDAAASGQSFTLKRAPLCHTPAASGGASTLTVRVGGAKWREAPSFLDQGPDDQVYVVRHGADGRATVHFGDGVRGARLPTGSANVHATYRVGGGPDGDVPAGSLTLLHSRPAGVRAVTNPLPARDGAAAERLEDARRNAPMGTRILDRVVSVADHEDFARSFPGVGKARATTLWNGTARVIHITATPDHGAATALSGTRADELRAALEAIRDPGLPVEVAGCQRVRVVVRLAIRHDPALEGAPVRAAVRKALLARFGPAARDLAQGMAAAEVVAAAQAVPGVVAVDLDHFHIRATPPPANLLEERLGALPARFLDPDGLGGAAGVLHLAQLLALDDGDLAVEGMDP